MEGMASFKKSWWAGKERTEEGIAQYEVEAKIKSKQLRRAREKFKRIRWANGNPEAARERRRRELLKSFYGITQEEWNRLFESQGRQCAICTGSDPCSPQGWVCDHDHSRGKNIRGILCQPCNMMLGGAKDNPMVLKSAADYLLRPYLV